MNRLGVLIIVVVFVLTNVYSLLVGKYQFFPYGEISELKQRINKALEVDYFYSLERSSPKVQQEKMNSDAFDLERKDRFGAAADVTEKIRRLINVASPVVPDRNIELPEPSAYSVSRSVKVGQPLGVSVHAPRGARVEIYWLGKEKTLVEKLPAIEPVVQSGKYSAATGLAWRQNLLIHTEGLKSGYYLLELHDDKTGARHQMPFVVSPARASKIAFVAATYTWAAFNDFSGKNFYGESQVPHEIVRRRAALGHILDSLALPPLPISVPFARVDHFEAPINDVKPNVPHHSHLLRAAWNLTAFAEMNGIDYGVYTDDDLDRANGASRGALWDAEIIVLGPHTEYWTQAMFDNIREYIEKGGKVVFAGGNSAFFRVQVSPISITRMDHINPTDAAGLTGAYTGDISDPAFAPLEVEAPKHWVFSGTSVSKGSLFGQTSLNQRHESRARGVSGWEADQMRAGSEGFVLLARGTNIRGPAEMVFKETRSGGWVFNASSIPFAGALGIDPVVSRIMLNLLGGGPAIQ